MPTSISDGPLGLEVKHRWNGGFTINDLESAMPRVILDPQDGITGLHDLPDSDNSTDSRTGGIGEALWPGYERGKTIVYKGELEAPTQHELAALRQQMRRAFRAGMSTPRLMEMIPHGDYGADVWGYYGRVLPGGLQIDEKVHRSKSHPHGAFARQFQLSIRMPDPRFLLTSDYVNSTGHATGVAAVINNPGDAFADPKFTITVPTGLPTITLTNASVITPSGSARLRFNAVPAGSLVVDFTIGARFATIAGADAMRYFDSGYSNWWDEFIPGVGGVDDVASGDNTLNVTGGSWSVAFFPRCW